MKSVPGKHEALKILNNRIKACKWYPVCPIRRLFEAGKLDKKWIEWYCKGDWKRCVRYQM